MDIFINSISNLLGHISTRYVFPGAIFACLTLYLVGLSAFTLSNKTVLQSVRTNIGLSVANTVITGITITALMAALANLPFSTPLIPEQTWRSIPLPILFILGWLTVDFADYWNHRLMHSKWLWPIHITHHTDKHINWTTTMRVHFLEGYFMKVFNFFVLVWLGIPGVEAGIIAVVPSLYNKFVHVNHDIYFGRIGARILACPRWHQWHHSVDPSAHNKNFANMFAFWDYIFGTWHCPGPCNTAYGVKGIEKVAIEDELARPFIMLHKNLRQIWTRKQSLLK